MIASNTVSKLRSILRRFMPSIKVFTIIHWTEEHTASTIARPEETSGRHMAGADYRCISFEQDGPKATLTFARPDVLNALNRQLIDEALDAFDRLAADTRVLVLRGAGARAFAAGAALAEMRERTLWSDRGSGPRRPLARRSASA